jgi:tether containing UBX domain for GLUT4
VGGPRVVPRDGKERLVADLGMQGRVLVNFAWDENATMEARSGPVLKGSFGRKRGDSLRREGVDVVRGRRLIKEGEGGGWGRDGGSVPKWLKLPGRSEMYE